MRCGRVKNLLSEYVDGRLSPRLRAEVDRHLVSCADCASELASLKETVRLVRELPAADPPGDFHSQLHLRLAEAEAERRAAPATAPRKGFSARLVGVRNVLRRPAWRGALATAMAVVLVFSLARFALPAWDGNVWNLLASGRQGLLGLRAGEEEPVGFTGFSEEAGPGTAKTSPPGAGDVGGPSSSPDTAAAPSALAVPDPAAGGGDQIIYRATLTVEVEEFDQAGRRLDEVVADAGGYVEKSSVSLESKTKNGYYRIRVPRAAYAGTLSKLEELGRVLRREQDTEDVTGTIIDLEARITNLHRQELRLGELLGQANTLDEILRVENELNRVRYQIEAYQGQLNHLRERVAWSTITVHLSEPEEPQPPPVPGADLWRRIRQAFVETWRGIGRFLEGLAVFIASVIPVVLVLAGLWYGYRKWRESRARL